MSITYEELAAEISRMTPEQRQMNVTVSCDVSEEALPAKSVYVTRPGDILDGVLDHGHPVITIDF